MYDGIIQSDALDVDFEDVSITIYVNSVKGVETTISMIASGPLLTFMYLA